jgi:hypothetical protein
MPNWAPEEQGDVLKRPMLGGSFAFYVVPAHHGCKEFKQCAEAS